MIAVVLGALRGMMGRTTVVSVRTRAGGRPGGGGVGRGVGVTGCLVVSMRAGPALAMRTDAESGAGPLIVKFCAVRVWFGSTGLSNVTVSVTESDAAILPIRGGTVSCTKMRRSVRTLSTRPTETLSQGSLGSIDEFLFRST